MCLAQGPQRSDAGEARTLGLKSSTLPLSHCAPIYIHIRLIILQFYKHNASLHF